MTLIDLTNYILYLNPEAKFSIWDTTDISQYMGESAPISLDNKFIDWGVSNTSLCPSWEEIQACDPMLVESFTKAREKEIRNEHYKSDKIIVSNFKVAQMLNPELTWSDFLDTLDEEVE